MKNHLYLLMGHFCLALGVIGAFLPILPTTPFLLLAAFCYSKSSKKYHLWLRSHKYLGPPITNWQQDGVISLKAKIFATIMVSLVMIFRIPYLKIALFIRIFVLCILIMVLIFIWTRPSKVTSTKNLN